MDLLVKHLFAKAQLVPKKCRFGILVQKSSLVPSLLKSNLAEHTLEDLSWQPTAPNMINLTTNNDGLKNGNFFKLWQILGMNNSYIN